MPTGFVLQPRIACICKQTFDVIAYDRGGRSASYATAPAPAVIQAAALDREHARQRHERAVVLMDRGEYRTALEEFKGALAATTGDPEPESYLNIAVCHAYLREFSEALTILSEAIQRWPSNSRLKQNYDEIKAD